MVTKMMIPWGAFIAVTSIMALLAFRSLFLRTPLWEKIVRALRFLIMGGLIAVIALRPMVENGTVEVEMKNLDVLFVIDSTISMWAEDYDGGKRERMEGVIEDCHALMEDLQGANFAVIKFDNRSRILSPFTQDFETVNDILDLIERPSSLYAKGSSLNTPMSDMDMLLSSSRKKENRKSVVFFFSDGEITDNSKLMSYRNLGTKTDYGAVLGYGTAAGGKMRSDYGSYIKDYSTMEDARSIIDEENLSAIASDLGVEYIHMDPDVSLKSLAEVIRQSSSITLEKKKIPVFEDKYWIFAIPLVIILILELLLYIHRDRLL